LSLSTASSRILVVAATNHELAPAAGWRTLRCGIGPVDAAIATAAAIAEDRPAAILHVGIAGVRRALALAPATLVIGTVSHYDDLHLPAGRATPVIHADPALLAAAQRALPHAQQRAIATSARVGGSRTCDVEAMEGFGVLRAAALADIPAIEVRVISNHMEEEDRARWHFAEAFAAITAATPSLVAEIAQCVR
jgi:nucleoside phosphorylase